MRQRPGSCDGAVVLALAASLLSFALWGFALAFGFDEPPAAAPPGYRTYFQQDNWWPFPFFFLAIIPGLWSTWLPLLGAWAELRQTGVLRARSGSFDDARLERLLAGLGRWRIAGLLLALLIAAGVNAADWKPSFPVYFGEATRHQQLRLACDFQGPTVKWLLAAGEGRGALLCVQPRGAASDVRSRPASPSRPSSFSSIWP